MVGRKAGSTDFKYSDAMQKAAAKGLIWDEKNLNAYVEDPKEREDVIAYLKSLK